MYGGSFQTFQNAEVIAAHDHCCGGDQSPSCPTNVSAVLVSNGMRVSWHAPAEGVVTAYQIELVQLSKQIGLGMSERRCLVSSISAPTCFCDIPPYFFKNGVLYSFVVTGLNNGCCGGESEESPAVEYSSSCEGIPAAPAPRTTCCPSVEETHVEQPAATIEQAFKWLIADLIYVDSDHHDTPSDGHWFVGDSQDNDIDSPISAPQLTSSPCSQCSTSLNLVQSARGCTRSHSIHTGTDSLRLRTLCCPYCISSPRRLLLFKVIEANTSFTRLMKQLLIMPAKSSFEELHEQSLFVAIKTLPNEMRRLIGGLHLGMTSSLHAGLYQKGAEGQQFIYQALIRLVRVMQCVAGQLETSDIECIHPLSDAHISRAKSAGREIGNEWNLGRVGRLLLEDCEEMSEMSQEISEAAHRASGPVQEAIMQRAQKVIDKRRSREPQPAANLGSPGLVPDDQKDTEQLVLELIFEASGAVMAHSAVAAFEAATVMQHGMGLPRDWTIFDRESRLCEECNDLNRKLQDAKDREKKSREQMNCGSAESDSPLGESTDDLSKLHQAINRVEAVRKQCEMHACLNCIGIEFQIGRGARDAEEVSLCLHGQKRHQCAKCFNLLLVRMTIQSAEQELTCKLKEMSSQITMIAAHSLNYDVAVSDHQLFQINVAGRMHGHAAFLDYLHRTQPSGSSWTPKSAEYSYLITELSAKVLSDEQRCERKEKDDIGRVDSGLMQKEDNFCMSPGYGMVSQSDDGVSSPSNSLRLGATVSMRAMSHAAAAEKAKRGTKNHNPDCKALAFRLKEIGQELWHSWVAAEDPCEMPEEVKKAAALSAHLRDSISEGRSMLALELHRLVSRLRQLAFTVCQCPQPCYTTDSVCKVSY